MNSIRFRIAVAVILGAAFIAASVDPAAAFVRIGRQANATSPVMQAHWNDAELPLSSVIDPANNDISPALALSVVQASAQAWQDINTSYFTVNAHLFTGAPPDSQPDLQFDGQNSVFFDATGVNFPTAGVIAFVRSIVDLADGHTLDADMVYNDRDFFSSTSSPALTPAPITPPPAVQQTSVDLQAVLTHEYGHYFSLDHTSVLGSTMIPFIQNNTTQRTLELDDRAGNSTVYPESVARGLSADGVDFHATTGKISGTVVSGYNGSAIFGAHVEAFNLAAPTPDNTISAISGELTLRNGQGDFTIYGLPPGNYAVRIVPLDGVNTTAADANIGGPYNGLDINFEPEFWDAAESGNGFSDPPNNFTSIAVGAGATSSGINVITNTYPGRVIMAQHGAFENTVTFRNTGYLAVRFDPPFDQPYTIKDVRFATFTFNGIPATFLRAGLYPMNPATGLPDFSAPLFEQAPFVGSPNGLNAPVLNLVGTPGQTYFWACQFPSQTALPGFPANFPFLRMDFNPLERGLFANTYSISTALTGGILIDRNVAIDMTCQVDPSEVPIAAVPAVGGNRRATKTEFNFLPPANVRADGFDMPQNSLDHVDLVVRNPFAHSIVASGGAGNPSISVSPSPAATPPSIWATQAVDKNGNRSILSNAVILGLNEDANEPNGILNEATALTTPVVNAAKTYSPAGDQDCYSVMARPGDTIEASATATGQDGANNTDLVMLLFDNSKDLVAFNDDFTGLNPKITFVVPPSQGNSNAARKFTIQVTDFAGSAFQPTGVPQMRVPQTYTLSANVIPGAALAARIGRNYNPDEFAFVNSGPNPANPVAKFMAVIPRNAGIVPVRINVFDVNGRLVRTLVDRPAEAGVHTTIWDGRDNDGRTVASGNYFARISAGKFESEARVTILK